MMHTIHYNKTGEERLNRGRKPVRKAGQSQTVLQKFENRSGTAGLLAKLNILQYHMSQILRKLSDLEYYTIFQALNITKYLVNHIYPAS